MPDTLHQHFTTEFSTNWQHRVQQSKARLDDFVVDENFSGERKRYDRLGAQSSRERTERKGPTIIQEANSDSRWAVRRSFDLANLLDKDDAKNLGQLVLPTSDYVKSHAMAYHRDCDDIAWKAALDPVLTGELGTTPFSLPSSQIILHGSTGMTIAKLNAALDILDGADLLDEEAPRVFVWTVKQRSELMNTVEAKSADYNTVKALAEGKIDTFMGFKFKIIKRLPLVGGVRTNVAWVKGAIKRTKGAMSSDISIRKDLSMSTQIYSDWHLGATRVYDEGVVAVQCQE